MVTFSPHFRRPRATRHETTAGDITFVVKHPSTVPYQFTIERVGVNYRSPNIDAGATGANTVSGLPAGECQLGHGLRYAHLVIESIVC